LLNPYEHNRAVTTFPHWVENDFARMFPEFSNNLYADGEVVYQQNDYLTSCHGKDLMIIGGGPSSKNEVWKETKTDSLWTMNQFYKSTIFEDQKIDLAMIMGETNLNDPGYIKRRDKDNILIGFESHDRWIGYKFDDYRNYFCMHTRFYGRIGIGARMMIFAASVGFKNVFFTGLDGPDEIYLGNHAFEPGKTTLPSIFVNQPPQVVAYHHKMQYDYLWNFIRDKYPDTKFVNLGGGNKYHEECR